MKPCNYSMNVALLGLAREMGIMIPKLEVAYGGGDKLYHNFDIDIKRPPYGNNTDIGLDWVRIKNKDVMFVSLMGFSAKINPNENVKYFYYLVTFATTNIRNTNIRDTWRCQLLFNP